MLLLVDAAEEDPTVGVAGGEVEVVVVTVLCPVVAEVKEDRGNEFMLVLKLPRGLLPVPPAATAKLTGIIMCWAAGRRGLGTVEATLRGLIDVVGSCCCSINS